jgi:hypothetical protein
MDLEHVGVECKLVDASEFLQIDIHREVQPAVIDRPLFQSAGDVAKRLTDVGGGKLDPVFLQRVWQDS